MDTSQTPSVGSTSRFVFWWLLANLAETAIRIRATVMGAPRSTQASGAETLGRIEVLPTPLGIPEPSIEPTQIAYNHYPLSTIHFSLKPLALAGLAAYVMGIAVVLMIRAQIV
ncbi:MAG: hypothetical protein WD906_03540 [Anaerolineales bacterium]